MKKNLGTTLISIAIIVFSFGYILGNALSEETKQPVEKSSSNSNNIELKVEGTGNNPLPLDYDLQGSKNQVKNQNNLQNTTPSSALQPNAKTDSLEN